MSIDSLELGMSSAGGGTRPPRRRRGRPRPPKAEAPLQYLAVFSPEPEGRAVVVGLEWGGVQEAGGRARQPRAPDRRPRDLRAGGQDVLGRHLPEHPAGDRPAGQPGLGHLPQELEDGHRQQEAAVQLHRLPERRQDQLRRPLPRPRREVLPLGRPVAQGLRGEGQGARRHPGVAGRRHERLPRRRHVAPLRRVVPLSRRPPTSSGPTSTRRPSTPSGRRPAASRCS